MKSKACDENFDEETQDHVTMQRVRHHCKCLAVDCEWRVSEVEEFIDKQNVRIMKLEQVAKDILNMLNNAFNKASVDEVTKSRWLSPAVTNSIQDLDCLLNGEGKNE